MTCNKNNNNHSKLSKIWFAWIWKYLSILFHKLIRPYKAKLFQPLYHLTSTDDQLRKQKKIRILEIGFGTGPNLEFYPPNSHYIGVEINDNFHSEMVQNLKAHNVVCERLIYNSAEDMKAVKENTIDAVITTLVLCSVPDARKVVQEVNRVLAPGGKWFLLEHGKIRRSLFHSFLQWCAQPIFYYLLDSCRLDMSIDDVVNSTLFTKNDVLYEHPKLFGLFRAPIFAFYIGTLTK